MYAYSTMHNALIAINLKVFSAIFNFAATGNTSALWCYKGFSWNNAHDLMQSSVAAHDTHTHTHTHTHTCKEIRI